jgi:ferritin-like metal-binding protein YciE
MLLFCLYCDKAVSGFDFQFTTEGITRMTAAKSTAKTKPTVQQDNEKSTDSRLREFFVDGLKDIYWAEQHIMKSLPKMMKAATSEQLQDAFATHKEQTQGQIERLNQVFELLGEKAQGKKCEAMEGILKEGESIVEETEDGTATRDVGLIMAAQKVEHYEIATYGGLAQLARTLGEDEVAELLEETLDEEKETDELLTGIAENDVNYEAAEEE